MIRFWNLRLWATRAAVAVVALLVASIWANSLLRITETTTELIVSAGDLERIVEQHRPSPPAGDTERDNPLSSQSPDVSATDDTKTEFNSDDKWQSVDDAPKEAANGTASEAPAPDTKTGDSDIADVSDQTSFDDDLPISLVENGREGSLASFIGAQGTAPADEHQPDEAGVIWDIAFVREPSFESLRSIEGTRLAAVRQRHGVTELATVAEHSVSVPTAVDDWLAEYPGYAARRGIILDRTWTRYFADKLVPYGGGWQVWLLVEDKLFADWVNTVEQELEARNLQWSNVQRVSAGLVVPNESGQCYLSIQLIESKALAAEIDDAHDIPGNPSQLTQ